MHAANVLNKKNFLLRSNASNIVSRSLKELNLAIKEGSTLFDIASGDGAVLMHSFVGNSGIKFSKIIGSDINPEFVEFANKKFGDSKTSFEVFDIFGELLEKNNFLGSFDVISCFHFFHWLKIEGIKKTFTNVKSLLKQNGHFYFFFPLNLAPPTIVDELKAKYKEDFPQIQPAMQFFKNFIKDNAIVQQLKMLLEDQGFEAKFLKNATVEYTFDRGELKALAEAVTPFFKVMNEGDKERLLGDIVEIFEKNNEKMTKNPDTASMDYVYCLAELKQN